MYGLQRLDWTRLPTGVRVPCGWGHVVTASYGSDVAPPGPAGKRVRRRVEASLNTPPRWTPFPMVSLKTCALPWLLLSAGVVGVDHVTKLWALAALPEYQAVPVFDGWWNWYRSYNPGAAFSMLSTAGGWQRYVLTVLALAVAGGLVVWLRRTGLRNWALALPVSLIIGGALSNAWDRLLRGHVVDFIQWYWRGYFWPSHSTLPMWRSLRAS